MRGNCSCCMLVHMQVKGVQVQANNITPSFTVTIAISSPISLEPIVLEGSLSAANFGQIEIIF